jgi:hypothetical protein
MSTLEQQIIALAQGVGADIKTLNNMIGVLSGLNTAAKSNLVAALNEVQVVATTNATAIGPLGGLTTTAKSNLVAAINEVKAAVSAVDLTALINDTALAGVTNKTYSVDKILTLLSNLETKIMGGITPEALDTIKELADYLSSETVANGIVAQMAKRVRVDSAQSFTAGEQAQGRANIAAAAAAELATLTANIGDTNHNFVADYNAAKA